MSREKELVRIVSDSERGRPLHVQRGRACEDCY
jgi:hypothetical protein